LGATGAFALKLGCFSCQPYFDQFLRVLAHSDCPTEGGSRTVNKLSKTNRLIFTVFVGEIIEIPDQRASLVMTECPGDSTRDGILVGSNESSQGLRFLFINSDVSSTTTVLLFKTVIDKDGVGLILLFGLHLIFNDSGEGGALLGPIFLFRSIYFFYYDVNQSP